LIAGVRETADVRNFLAPQPLGSPMTEANPSAENSAMESSIESLSNVHVNGTASPPKLTAVPGQIPSADPDQRMNVEHRPVHVSRSGDESELTPITIPIFDMMIELFNLHQDSNWPRKALFDAVQRLLGGRLERCACIRGLSYVRIVREQVGKYVVESYIVDIMKQIQDSIWPDGVLRKNRLPRTTKEKSKTKRDASFKLAAIFEGQHPKLI